MSNNIPKISLEDSLYVLQLAREAALAKNRRAQADRMNPVVEEMRGLVANSYQTSASISPSTGVMGQFEFKSLLDAAQSRSSQPAALNSTQSVMDRNRMIGAMAEANMTDVEIARQFSMSREEVQLILSVQRKVRR